MRRDNYALNDNDDDDDDDDDNDDDDECYFRVHAHIVNSTVRACTRARFRLV